MEKIILLVFIFIGFNQLAFTAEVEKRRNAIIKIIDEELSEVNRLSIRGGEKDPNLLLRIAELYLEKARLYREKENQRYLNLEIKKRQKVNKKKFFSKSQKYFEKANDSCRKITKKFKRYSKMGEVYYILGYNLKEAQKNKKASNYLQKATRVSKTKKVKVKSQLTLADIHFNDRKFSKAKYLYEKALKNYKDKWWTKDSFNLAWCYYHLNRYSDAINKMREVYNNSKKSKFIDMRSQVERDIGVFYATSGKIDQGITFYRKIGVSFSKRLFDIAFILKRSGKFEDAEKVLNHSIRYSKGKRNFVAEYLELLDIYLKSARYEKHASVSEKTFSQYKKSNMDKEQVKTFVFQLEKVAAVLQRQVLSKTYRRLIKIRNMKAKQTKRYFDLLSKVNPERYDEFQFLRGETAYATSKYSEAYDAYKKTFEYSVKNKKTRFKRKSMDNMLVTLSRFSKKYKLNIYVFEGFVREFKKDKKVKQIYERLFNNYMSLKDYDKAKFTLDRYSKLFPKSSTVEAMIAQLMDVSRKRGDNVAVRAWVSSIESGKYIVGAKYKNKLLELLTTMQMEDVQGELKKGNKQVALVGYHNVLKDKYSTKKSKINAKYNLAALYFELGDAENAFKWSVAAIDEMGSQDVKKFQGSFVTIANYLFMSLHLSSSAKLSKKILEKICKTKSKTRNLVFKNAAFMSLADNDITFAESVRDLGKKCKISTKNIRDVNFEIMRELYLKGKLDLYEKYIAMLSSDSYFKSKIVDEYINLYFLHNKYNNENRKQLAFSKARQYFKKSKSSRTRLSIKTLDFFADIEVQKMKSIVSKAIKSKLAYPEKVFQKAVETKLKSLDRLVEQANSVIQIGSGRGIISAYHSLYSTYRLVGQQLGSFTPPGKSKEYLAGFKKQFNTISSQMFQAAEKYKKEALRTMKKNEILSNKNFYFQNSEIQSKFFGTGVLMDRGGIK